MQKIAPDVKLGKDVKIYDFVNLYGCTIGSHTRIGAFVEIQKSARIGSLCKISSHTFICEGVTIEDECWIGAMTVILDGVRIGYRSVVAAGSVVTRDVPPHSVVAGVPARVIRDLRGLRIGNGNDVTSPGGK